MAEKVKNTPQASTPVQTAPLPPPTDALKLNTPPPVPNGNGRKKNGKPIDPNETKAQRFSRLANARVPRVLRMLGHIENLTRAASYEYTPEQADKIVAVLALAIKRIADGFKGEASKQGGFSL